MNWSLDQVIELFPGKDCVEHVAKLRLASGEIIRPLQRIYPLELSACDHLFEIAPAMPKVCSIITSQNKNGGETFKAFLKSVVTLYPPLGKDQQHRVESMAALVSEYTLEFFTLLNARSKKELIEWCMKEGLIASSYECPKCNEQMGLNEGKSVVLDGFEWRC
ncbi:uncharacterized protein TNCV_1368381 [Trichonephila clavipes]|nr:uncharacterized protein TNCV_1368381 [Trichonephila clavipes]